MAMGSAERNEERSSLRWKRLVALLSALGFLALLIWWLERRTNPGRPVEIHVTRPRKDAVLRPGRAVLVSGRVRGAGGRVFCNGVRAVTKNGRFTVELPGPKGPGLYVLDCHAKNDRGTDSHARFGRLAGWTAPMTAPMDRAVTLTVPLSILDDKGGLLGDLNDLLRRHLVPILSTKGSLNIGPFQLGPVWVTGLHVEGVETTVSGRLDFHIVIERPCMKVGRVRAGSTICLPVSFHATVGLSLDRNAGPVLHMGRFTTEGIRNAPWLPGLDLAAAAGSMISRKLGRVLAWPAETTRGLAKALTQAKRRIDRRLSALTDMIPQVPAAWDAAGTRLCFSVSLSGLDTDPLRETASVTTRVQILGYDPKGTCQKVVPFPSDLQRLVPAVAEKHPTEVPADGDALLVLSSDFVNAYLTGLWAVGALRRVPIASQSASRFGFSLESMEMGVPPAFVPGRYLRLVVPEAGLWVRTLGEPKRYFVVSVAAELRLLLSSAGVELAVMDNPLPRVALRCEGELGRSSCLEQTHRYQSMVNMVLAMVRAGRMVLPALPVAKALPQWRTKYVELEPVWVRRWRDGIGVGLDVAPIHAAGQTTRQQSVQPPPSGLWPVGP